jgi:hypothetical protein
MTKILLSCGIAIHVGGMAFFAWTYSKTGADYCIGFMGWCLFWGAYCTRELRRWGAGA